MEEIDARVAHWFETRDAADAIEVLTSEGVAVGLVYDAGMMLEDDFLRQRGAVVTVPDADLGQVTMPGVVPRLTESGGSIRWAGPRLGEHNDEVLRGLLGLSSDEIDALAADGVIGYSDDGPNADSAIDPF